MTDTAPQETTESTLQDMLDSGVLEILNASDGQDQYTLLTALEALRVVKEEACAFAQSRAVQLLLWCYSMRLDAGCKTEPFLPAFRMPDGSTTATPYHLSVDQVQLLAGMYDHVKPAARRARLADLVSIMIRRRRIDHAIAAIDAYMETPLNADDWHLGGTQHWHRALVLSISFHPGIGNRFEAVESALFRAFEAACAKSEGTEPLVYLRPLKAEGVSKYANAIAARLQHLADSCESKGNLDGVVYIYEALAYWHGLNKNMERSAFMLNRRASVTETKADGLATAILRQSFYTDALRFYREIDGRFHRSLEVRKSIERVQVKLEAAGVAALGEMQIVHFSAPKIDIGDQIELAVNFVRGRSIRHAMTAFVALDPWPSRAAYLDQARELAKGSTIASLMGSTYLAADGRQIEKIGPLTGDKENDAAALDIKAMQCFVQYAELTAQMTLSPAMSQIYMEHALTLGDFQLIAEGCSIISLSHADAVARGLYAGYQRDFVAALHILLPQFENIVRVVLKNAGAITTTTDVNGISMEIGLSALLDRAQMVPTFGENLTFGIRALMCAQVGPNFRNDIAHGLATSANCHTLAGFYTWWFIFRLIFIQWDLAHQGDPTGESSGDAAHSASPA